GASRRRRLAAADGPPRARGDRDAALPVASVAARPRRDRRRPRLRAGAGRVRGRRSAPPRAGARPARDRAEAGCYDLLTVTRHDELDRAGDEQRFSVSMVLPMFNEEETIEHALEVGVAALERHARDWELVVVDDASTDRSPAMVAAASEREPRIRLL